MANRENVIKGLKTCYCPPAKCEDCPYDDIENCNDTLCLDALALLKEQEMATVEKYETEIFMLYSCGSCGTMIAQGDKYCRMCGKRLKWNEE